jgi:hypothetical protein
MNAIVDIISKEVLSVFEGAAPDQIPAGRVVIRLVDVPNLFNATTHTRVFERYEVAGAKVTRFWKVTEKTPQELYEAQLAKGYTDPTTGIKLKTTEHAQAKFGQLATLLSAALSAGAVAPSAPHRIYDFSEAEHNLPTVELMALLLRYGFFCAQLFIDHAP